MDWLVIVPLTVASVVCNAGMDAALTVVENWVLAACNVTFTLCGRVGRNSDSLYRRGLEASGISS